MKFRVILDHDATEEEVARNTEEAIRLYLSPADIDLPEIAKLAEVAVG